MKVNSLSLSILYLHKSEYQSKILKKQNIRLNNICNL